MAHLAQLVQQICRGELPPPPVATLLGFTLTAVDAGHAVIAFEATPRHTNPMETLHGGV